jgi:hypothetical protein
MWFSEVAAVENPGVVDLQRFVTSTMAFLAFVLEAPEFGFLWENDGDLAALARETFQTDVQRSARELFEAIPGIPERTLSIHGLLGRPMRFKNRVVDSIGRQWERVRAQLSIPEWFRKIIEAIDAALDSLIAAAGGVGGLVKEFKDALLALAPAK